MSLRDPATLEGIFPPATGSRPSSDQFLDAVAHFCAALLNAKITIWDTMDCHPVRMTNPYESPNVSQLMFVEHAYAHDAARTNTLAELSKKMSLAELFSVCYQRVYLDSRGVDRKGLYDLRRLARKEAYHTQVTHSRANDVFGRAPLRAGGLVDALYDAVFPTVLKWATKVFTTIASQVDGGSAEAATIVASEQATALIERISIHITCRALCKPCGSHDDPLASSVLDTMSSRYVEAELVAYEDTVERNDADGSPIDVAEVARTSLDAGTDWRWGGAMRRVHADTNDVRWLARLACSSTPEEVGEVLRLGIVELGRVVASPPPELRTATSWCKCASPVLAVVVDGTQDAEKRILLAQRWISSNGPFASAACQEALNRLRVWKPMDAPFLETITLWNGPGEFPRLEHTPQRNHYRFAQPRAEVRVRTGLSPTNECAVRFVSVVWDLVGRHDEMRTGRLHAGVVCDVSLHCSTESMLVQRLLHEKIIKEGLCFGPTLHATADEIMESDGQFSAEVAEASHAVCHQTIAELFAPLQITDDVAMEVMTSDIGRRMRPLLHTPPDEEEVVKLKANIHEREMVLACTVVAPVGARAALASDRRALGRLLRLHPAFVYDAYALAATAVAKMRHRLRIPSISAIHPVVSGLVGSPLVRAWTPAAGPLVLNEQAVANLPADTRLWLMAIAGKNSGGGNHRRGFALCTRRHVKGESAQIVLLNPYALMRLVVHCALTPSI